MINTLLNGMITILFTKFVLNDVPHAVGIYNTVDQKSFWYLIKDEDTGETIVGNYPYDTVDIALRKAKFYIDTEKPEKLKHNLEILVLDEEPGIYNLLRATVRRVPYGVKQ